MKYAHIEEIIQKLLDDCATADELQLLEQELLNDPGVMETYLSYTGLENLLQMRGEICHGPVIPINRIRRRQNLRNLRIAVLSTAAIILVTLVSMRLFLVSDPPPKSTFHYSAGTQFTISHSHNNKENSPNELYPGSRLVLTQGTVELNLDSGVKSIITAPADLTLNTHNALMLKKGTGWFHVPEQARGFKVDTTELEIVDLGTEFGVISTPSSHDEVHLLKGKIKVSASKKHKESSLLTANQALRVDSVGHLIEIPADPSVFMKTLPDSLPYLHWSFDTDKNNSFLADGDALNLTKSAASPRNAIAKNLIVSGKYGNAAAINNYSDELVTSHSGIKEDKAWTVACWVKIISPPKTTDRRSCIVGWGNQNLSPSILNRWQISISANKNGDCILDIIGLGFLSGTTPITVGEWHHVAIVWKPSKSSEKPGTLEAYIDGFPDTLTVKQPDNLTSPPNSPISIGATMHQNYPEYHAGSLRGHIDELFIIEGALSQENINHLKQYNKVLIK